MDYEIPQWLRDDYARRRQAKIKARRDRFLGFLLWVLKLVAVSAVLGSMFYGAYALGQVGADDELYEPPAVPASVEVSRVVVATVTAYTSSVDETDDTPFITASGASTGHGVIACPPKYPFGTEIFIRNTKYVCEDRMNPRYHAQERFDIWVATKAEAFEWGIQEVRVRVIAQG